MSVVVVVVVPFGDSFEKTMYSQRVVMMMGMMRLYLWTVVVAVIVVVVVKKRPIVVRAWHCSRDDWNCVGVVGGWDGCW